MLVFNRHLPFEVRELFDAYTAAEIVEFLDSFDLFLEGLDAKEEMGREMRNQYALTIYLLKNAVRAIEPPKIPSQSLN